MKNELQKIKLSFEYPVIFTKSAFSTDNPIFNNLLCRLEPSRKHRFFVFIDQGVARCWPELIQDINAYTEHYSDNIELAGKPEVIVGGEMAKSDPALLELAQRRLYENHLDRQSFVVTIGGGAVQDMTGYAAATVHRGLRTVRFPTTVLSQNDSGVGVKNGINAFGTKNFLGTFWPPFGVISDRAFLTTLSDRDKLAGISETVKVALIRDANLFLWLEANVKNLTTFEPEAMSYMVEKGALLHMRHIATSGDPFEFGAARPLDFGHWVAHKLESMTNYKLRHGEAVAIGLLLDSRYSMATGLLGEESFLRIHRLLKGLGLKLWDDALVEKDAMGRLEVLKGLDDFREHLGGELTVTLLEQIGKGVEVNEIDVKTVAECIKWLEREKLG